MASCNVSHPRRGRFVLRLGWASSRGGRPRAEHDGRRWDFRKLEKFVAAKPILIVFMQSRGVPEPLRTVHVRLPSFTYPEDAALALARVARYSE